MIIYAADDEPLLLKKLGDAILEVQPECERHSFSRATLLLSSMGNETP